MRPAAAAACAAALLLAGCGNGDGSSLLGPLIEVPAGDGGVLFSDTAASADALGVWGSVDCAEPTRVSFHVDGGDNGPTATGAAQGNSAFRRLTVLDGDDFYGERCELGENDHRSSPVAVYGPGEHIVTFASLRLPDSFPIETPHWQGGLQMKQAQPADNADGTPVLSLGAYGGRWVLTHSGPGYTIDDQPVWSAPAERNRWTRFAFDVVYSADPAEGRITVLVDLNGDGDFEDTNEHSDELALNTLKLETAGDSDDGYAEGDSLVSHLRAGLYHDPVIGCPPPYGCSIDLDNVQVISLDPAPAPGAN